MSKQAPFYFKWTHRRERHARESTTQLGQGIIEYAILLVLVALAIMGSIAVLGGGTADLYQRVVDTFDGKTPTVTPEDEQPDRITVKVVNASENGIADVPVYAFTDQGDYTGQERRTNQNGIVEFRDFADGSYKFRADYQAEAHWSNTITWPAQNYAVIQIQQRPFPVKVTDAAGGGIPEAPVYAFNSQGDFTGVKGRTGANGVARFDLRSGDFKFRADYQAQQYWSGVVTLYDDTSATINTGQRPFLVKVVDDGGRGVADAPVYAFNARGDYSGVSGRTDEDGAVRLDLGTGEFKFRADYKGWQYWSEVTTLHNVSLTTIKVGSRLFQVTVSDAAGGGIPNQLVYAFASQGYYTGIGGYTNASGVATLDMSSLAAGDYRFRLDIQFRRFWSKMVTIPGATRATIETGERPFPIKVTDAAGNGIPGVRVYAFVGNGSYLGIYGNTGADGVVTFILVNGDYKFQAEYQYRQFWTEAIIPNVTSATIETGQCAVTVTVVDADGKPQANMLVLAISDQVRYFGVNGFTAADGRVTFDLAGGTYRFRVDTDRGYFWSESITVPAAAEAKIVIR